MKSVLISIRPEWCEKIASGKKTIEVRKTRPKIETPFKCYIYMTEGNASYPVSNKMICHNAGGKCVIGEFVCDAIIPFSAVYSGPKSEVESKEFPVIGATGMTGIQIVAYLGNGVTGYGWHISELKIYDKPKELSEFWAERICHRGTERNECAGCWDCEKRPPQSWMYVEGLE